MTLRILPRAEWPRLVGTELEHAWPHFPASDDEVFVMVVEDGARIIGCWAAIQYWHVHGLWIAPAHRRTGTVAWRGLRFMLAQLRARGVKAALTSALTDDVRRLAVHIGGIPLPGDSYVFPVGGV
jgi:hypothetical protein